jgi:hypothetical protein
VFASVQFSAKRILPSALYPAFMLRSPAHIGSKRPERYTVGVEMTYACFIEQWAVVCQDILVRGELVGRGGCRHGGGVKQPRESNKHERGRRWSLACMSALFHDHRARTERRRKEDRIPWGWAGRCQRLDFDDTHRRVNVLAARTRVSIPDAAIRALVRVDSFRYRDLGHRRILVANTYL